MRQLDLDVCVDFSNVALADLRTIARRAAAEKLAWDVSVIGADDYTNDASPFPAGGPCHGARQRILEAWAHIAPDACWPFFAAAALLGGRRISTEVVAEHLGMSTRTLRRRLDESNCAPARAILQWALLLHTVWRLEVLGMTTKQVSYLAGYEGATPWKALGEYFYRRLGMRPRDRTLEERFDRLLTMSCNAIVPKADINQ
jgi:AraC-like DNA-binding protein